MKSYSLSRNEWLVLGLLYCIATAININKAYHIDDTFHLEAANWLREHPLRPMSGLINWDENREPMFVANQPPLYFYFLALVSSIFGTSEVTLHLFQSIFTFFTLCFFLKITKVLQFKKGILLTTLLALCPAFLVNQNLMVDIPLLCFNVWVLYELLKPEVPSESARYWKVGLLISAGLLIKYTNLPLVVVLLGTLLWRKQYRYLYVVLFPVITLIIWSLWNYIEVSAIHIVGRPSNPMTADLFKENIVDFVTCLGAISPFSLAFVAGYFYRHKINTLFIPVIAILFAYLTLATAKERIFILTSNDILTTAFLINGLLIILLVFGSVFRNSFTKYKAIDVTDVILLLYILGFSGFIILFAPFIASRHVLLIIPPVLLLGGRWVENISFVNAIQATVVAATITLILAISDWLFADFYRQKAKEVAALVPKNSRVWSAGHWGWQWYADKEGFLEVQGDTMQFQTGDYLVRPFGISTQKIPDGAQFQQVNYVTSPFSWLHFVSTSYYSAFYAKGSAWAYSRFPMDTVKIYRVVAINPVTKRNN